MPDVTNTDVDGTGRKLQSAGLTVRVTRQKTLAESRDKKMIVLPEIMRSFQPSTWSHMIAAQEPAEGTPVHPGSVVTLIAGIHHGAGPFQAWLKAHGSAVTRRGDVRCRDLGRRYRIPKAVIFRGHVHEVKVGLVYFNYRITFS